MEELHMDRRENFEQTEEQIPVLAELAVRQAYRDALAAGQSVLTADSGTIFEIFPDGTRREVKRINPPTPAIPAR